MSTTVEVDPSLPIAPSRSKMSLYRSRFGNTGAVGPSVVLLLLFILYAIIAPTALSLPQLNTLGNGAATVAIAAAGTTVIVLVGGFDLSVGAVLSLVNVLIATQIGTSPGSQAAMIFLGLAVGAGAGLVNGLLVVYLRIPSIVATLAMSFLWGGLALLVLAQPGGAVPIEFVNWFTGNIGNFIPASLVLVIAIIAIWLLIKRTKFARSLYAVGGDPTAAASQGIRVRLIQVLAYTLGGLLYGLGGVFLSAQSASGDPNVGIPLLLTVFAAVVIGGTVFGGGRGDLVGSIVGAYVIYLIADVLFALGVSSFYTNILNGAVLLLAVILGSVSGVRRWRSSKPVAADAPIPPDENKIDAKAGATS